MREELRDLDAALPDFLNANGLGMSGPGIPGGTITSPCTLPSIGSPAYFASAAWIERVTWLQPAAHEHEITAVARGLKWGGFGAYGFTPDRGRRATIAGAAGFLAEQQAMSIEGGTRARGR